MTELSPGPIVLWLSSRYENIELALAALAHVCRHRGIAEDTEHWMGLALREAVANAIKHGNRQDPTKKVYLSFGGHDGEITVEVADEGEGFDPQRVADPLAEANQLKTSGRGIFYMKTFMDDVAFSKGASGGTVLRMRKRLASTDEKEKREQEG